MEDDEGLYAALRKINRAGVVLLENVGVEDRAVLDLARRIAPISHQALFGEVFDIGSQVSGIGGRHWEHNGRVLPVHTGFLFTGISVGSGGMLSEGICGDGFNR